MIEEVKYIYIYIKYKKVGIMKEYCDGKVSERNITRKEEVCGGGWGIYKK